MFTRNLSFPAAVLNEYLDDRVSSSAQQDTGPWRETLIHSSDVWKIGFHFQVNDDTWGLGLGIALLCKLIFERV